ncbi:MAG: hypothetical protein KDA84_21690, partial [Planctomycetaceae bacterium]|nr:hypothetical protein [Planctomycetaceae bacterium]
MTKFLNQFQPDPDPDMASIRRVWTTDKPLLREAVVQYAPPYAEYPELESDEVPSEDPSCPSARNPSDSVVVAIYSVCGNGFGSYQQLAWEFLTSNADSIEHSLRRKLYAQHLKSKHQFLEEDLRDF